MNTDLNRYLYGCELLVLVPGLPAASNPGFPSATCSSPALYVISYDSVQTVKKLIAYCNSPAGYYITLSASVMTSESAAGVIKYTVASGGATVTTAADGNETASATKVTEKTSLTKIDYFGALITVTVNETDYLSAVTGTYTGTIKIILVSN